MPIVALLGSFPNSQIRPRPVTQNETILNPVITNNTSDTVAAANPNRTIMTLLNEGPGSLRWMSADEGTPDMSTGFLLLPGAAIQIDTQEEILGYAFGGNCNLSLQIGEG
jgi:hypothetical protein